MGYLPEIYKDFIKQYPEIKQVLRFSGQCLS